MLTEMLKNKKGPLSYQKIKCSFLDYVQLLMIGWVIQAKNVDRNAKQWKRLPKSSKNQMFIFGLHSTSDDWLSNLSKNIDQNAKKQKGPLSHQKIKCSFLIMFNFWWSANQSKQKCWPKCKKMKRPPKSLKNKMFVFGLCSTSDERQSDLSKKCRPKC